MGSPCYPVAYLTHSPAVNAKCGPTVNMATERNINSTLASLLADEDDEGRLRYTVIVISFYGFAVIFLLALSVFGVNRKSIPTDEEVGDYMKDISSVRERLSREERTRTVSRFIELSKYGQSSQMLTPFYSRNIDQYDNRKRTSTPLSPLVSSFELSSAIDTRKNNNNNNDLFALGGKNPKEVPVNVERRLFPRKNHVQLFLQREAFPCAVTPISHVPSGLKCHTKGPQKSYDNNNKKSEYNVEL